MRLELRKIHALLLTGNFRPDDSNDAEDTTERRKSFTAVEVAWARIATGAWQCAHPGQSAPFASGCNKIPAPNCTAGHGGAGTSAKRMTSQGNSAEPLAAEEMDEFAKNDNQRLACRSTCGSLEAHLLSPNSDNSGMDSMANGGGSKSSVSAVLSGEILPIESRLGSTLTQAGHDQTVQAEKVESTVRTESDQVFTVTYAKIPAAVDETGPDSAQKIMALEQTTRPPAARFAACSQSSHSLSHSLFSSQQPILVQQLSQSSPPAAAASAETDGAETTAVSTEVPYMVHEQQHPSPSPTKSPGSPLSSQLQSPVSSPQRSPSPSLPSQLPLVPVAAVLAKSEALTRTEILMAEMEVEFCNVSINNQLCTGCDQLESEVLCDKECQSIQYERCSPTCRTSPGFIGCQGTTELPQMLK